MQARDAGFTVWHPLCFVVDDVAVYERLDDRRARDARPETGRRARTARGHAREIRAPIRALARPRGRHASC